MFNRITAVAAIVVGSWMGSANAAMFYNFNEAGQTVNGYQDTFDGNTLDAGWTVYNGGGNGTMFQLTGTGELQMLAANGDPNKLLYTGASYSATNQNVLALIRVTNDPAGEFDGFRGGVNAASNTGNGQGINLHFREPGQNGPGNHFNLLNDAIAWGPSTGGGDWSVDSYKWLRLTYASDGTVTGKVWDAGLGAEPASPQLTTNFGGRSGFAGLTTNSIGGQGVFNVEYILIQAAGLPSITAAAIPEPASLSLVLVGGLALLRRRK